MDQPFLSVYTPTYRRPKALAVCKDSVARQTIPVQHVIIPDDVGIGIGGVYAEVPKHARKVKGTYVLFLSDDNYIIRDDFAERLREIVQREGYPDVVVFKNDIVGCIQPVAWREVQYGNIDLSCFVVERKIWQKHAGDWGHHYAGDFDFISKLYLTGYSFHWWDSIEIRALRISNGVPEA
jgi:glycosyltransferase involved in cell wall biosynthesis